MPNGIWNHWNSAMNSLERIVSHLDEYLALRDFTDTSQNGLQVTGKSAVKRIVGLVDASVEGFAAAVDARADMVIVHHGMLWNKAVSLTGPFYDRVKILIENGISLYAAHLPLDAHPETGNNIQLLEIVGAALVSWYAEWGGKPIGCIGSFKNAKPLVDIVETLDTGLDTQSRVLDFGPSAIKTVGIVSGSACEALDATKAAGADLFITGEARLSAYHHAQELGMNVVFAGHYATESVGIQALLNRLPSWFDVETLFIDIPCQI